MRQAHDCRKQAAASRGVCVALDRRLPFLSTDWRRIARSARRAARTAAVARALACSAAPTLSPTRSPTIGPTVSPVGSHAASVAQAIPLAAPDPAIVAQAASLSPSHAGRRSDSTTIASAECLAPSDAASVARRVLAARLVARTDLIALRRLSFARRLCDVGADTGRFGLGDRFALSCYGQSEHQHEHDGCDSLCLHNEPPSLMSSFVWLVACLGPFTKVVCAHEERLHPT